MASCSTFVNNKNITYNYDDQIINPLTTCLKVSVGLINIFKTKGFLESEEDPTLISFTPVYHRYNNMVNAANRIMNGDGLPPLDISVIFNNGIRSCKMANAAVSGNYNVLLPQRP